MIPKQLFFIWLGDDKPAYVDFAVKSFKEVNPDFDVDLIEYKVHEIDNIDHIRVSKYDDCVRTCISYILDRNCKKYHFHRSQFYKKERKFIQTIANMLRCELLNKYGGIYIDCDSFPLKKFDDFLLSKKSFCSYTFQTYDQFHRYRDNNFLGKEKDNKEIYDCYGIFDAIPISKFNYLNDDVWNLKRTLFFKCQLSYYFVNEDYYIEHFYDRTWRGRTPVCKYDII